VDPRVLAGEQKQERLFLNGFDRVLALDAATGLCEALVR